jgi:hypothetical protein
MNVSQFFDPQIRQWAETLSPTTLDLEARLKLFRPYAIESAERFVWLDEPKLGLKIRNYFEARELTLDEARDFLVWAVDEFCDGVLEASHALTREEAVIVLEALQHRGTKGHVTVLDWPMVWGGDAA